jgi:Phage terminase, small subunit
MKLTAKQEKFCNEYLIDLNATQAAIRAGYSEKTAAVIGAQNLIKLNIANFIQEKQKELQEETGITQKRVLEEYAKIAFSDIRQMFDGNNMLLSLKDVPDDIAACLSSVEVDQLWGASMDGKVQIGETKKVKVWNKINALDSLARHFGMFEKDNEQSKPVVHISGMEIK